MSKEDRRAETHRRVREYLRDLEERLDPAAFALFLRVVGGVNAALRRQGGHVDVELTPQERDLFVAELQHELVALLGLLGFPGDRITTDTGGYGRDRRGAGATARAGGTEP
ncbi:MAG TPA: hypothetical protein VE546_14350 [Streptomyces sp.]|uniref:hypothetical protein n=1 Tax=Streptomyces sp. TaxID=1931 RepID=UPI002D56485C|nr:hypothetical protein [Streptomyces sp.]HZG04730.1 hypothetical protein [Streptomyces sp.]